MFQIDLDTDLKEEHGLKGMYLFTLFGPVMQGPWIRLNLLKETILNMPESTEICPNVGKYSSISVIKNEISTIYLYMR